MYSDICFNVNWRNLLMAECQNLNLNMGEVGLLATAIAYIMTKYIMKLIKWSTWHCYHFSEKSSNKTCEIVYFSVWDSVQTGPGQYDWTVSFIMLAPILHSKLGRLQSSCCKLKELDLWQHT